VAEAAQPRGVADRGHRRCGRRRGGQNRGESHASKRVQRPRGVGIRLTLFLSADSMCQWCSIHPCTNQASRCFWSLRLMQRGQPRPSERLTRQDEVLALDDQQSSQRASTSRPLFAQRRSALTDGQMRALDQLETLRRLRRPVEARVRIGPDVGGIVTCGATRIVQTAAAAQVLLIRDSERLADRRDSASSSSAGGAHSSRRGARSFAA
jgi:hypothetical protein